MKVICLFIRMFCFEIIQWQMSVVFICLYIRFITMQRVSRSIFFVSCQAFSCQRVGRRYCRCLYNMIMEESNYFEIFKKLIIVNNKSRSSNHQFPIRGTNASISLVLRANLEGEEKYRSTSREVKKLCPLWYHIVAQQQCDPTTHPLILVSNWM